MMFLRCPYHHIASSIWHHHHYVPIVKRSGYIFMMNRSLSSFSNSRANITTATTTTLSNLYSWRKRCMKEGPGILSACTIAYGANYYASELGHAILNSQNYTDIHPISSIPIAIVIGMTVRYMMTSKVVSIMKPGITRATTTILRAGIIGTGIKLSLIDVAAVGFIGAPVISICMLSCLLYIKVVSMKLDLPRKTSDLIAAGTSICGVTAITAVAPAINASPRQTAIAVANVVTFGTMGMIVYPYIIHDVLAASPEQAGMLLGCSIHDTSQVIGAAMNYSELYDANATLEVASVTKLTRNLFLTIIVPVLSLYHASEYPSLNKNNSTANTTATKSRFSEIVTSARMHVPAFVGGFVGMAALRTIGDVSLDHFDYAFGLFEESTFKSMVSFCGGTGSTALLGTAMAALGMSIDVSILRGVGWRPFFVGATGSLVAPIVATSIICGLDLEPFRLINGVV